MSTIPATMPLGDFDQHAISDADCTVCWAGYPVACKCGGLIHASFGDESYDGYWLYTKCDRCGESE